MSEVAYIPSAAAEELTRALWDLSDPNPTRGTAALFAVEEALDKSKWLRVPLEISIPIHGAAELGEVADILRPWVGHGITQKDITLLEEMVVSHRGQRLVVYDALPKIFKLRDAGNPSGLGRTRAQLIEEGKLNAPSTAP